MPPSDTPGQLVEIPLELIRLAAAEAADRWPAEVGEVYATVPVGWYAFEAEVALPDGEFEARRHTVFVAEHQLGGFDDMDRAARDNHAGTGLDCDGFALQEEFFGASANPRPAAEHLQLLAEYARANGELPTRRSIAKRVAVSPRNLAEQIIHGDLKRSEARSLISAAREEAPELIDGFWGGLPRYTEEVLNLADFFDGHGVWPIDVERDGPYVRSPDRVEFEWGGADRDLEAVFEKVANDPVLFDSSPPKPEGGIHWDKRLTSGAWGYYKFAAWSITISPILNTAEAPEYVLEFVVFHELLHHHDHLTGWTGLPHAGDFRDRERKFPRQVEANGWLDAFADRYVADKTTAAETFEKGVSSAP